MFDRRTIPLACLLVTYYTIPEIFWPFGRELAKSNELIKPEQPQNPSSETTQNGRSAFQSRPR
ncbi:UNKNOWN [Stylonychia lemnae]|uniref:Uncharacterized protein n=1 Tax=Stylonychia lemnae TaxID=5949 RepID=A0A078B8R9_STYLE|nr:UNKNOWN [Stylonychia lemnae]|eukprot:CDW90621.1 UNKNOWN [Stylonychia lemnae]